MKRADFLPRLVALFFLVALGTSVHTSAFAQQPHVSDGSVPGADDSDSVAYRLPEVRVEVTRLSAGGVPLARVPLGAQVIEGDDFAARRDLTVAASLERLPGVSLADEVGSPLQPDVGLRGFGVSPVIGLPQGLSVFVDGVRVNEPVASEVNFNLIPLHATERTEVLRGPSAPFGKNALAGAINVVTRRGGEEGRRAAEISAGSFGRAETRLRAEGPAGPFDYHVSGRHLRTEGWRDAAVARGTHLFGKLGWSDETTDVWISYTHARDSILQAGSLPASWLENSSEVPERFRNGRDPRTINFTGGDYFGPTLHFLNTQLEHRFTDRLTVSVNGFFRRNDSRQFNANFTEPDTRSDNRIRSAGGIAQVVYDRESLQVSGGLEYTVNDVGIRIWNHPNANFPDLPETGEQREDVGTDEQNVALYGSTRIDVTDRVALSHMIRYDHVDLPFRDFLEPDNDGDNRFQQFSNALGLDVMVAPGVVVFGSAGRAFRAPTIMELACADPEDPCPLPYELGADPPLDAVTVDTWQAGVRFFRNEWLSTELIGYWAEVHDAIFNVQPPGTRTGYFENLDRTRRQGAELSVQVRPATKLRLHGDLTWTRATFQSTATLSAPYQDLDDEEEEPADPDGGEDEREEELAPPTVRPGDRMPMVPPLRLRLAATFTDDVWRADVGWRRVSDQWLRGDENNSEHALRLDPYMLVDLHLERQLGPVAVFGEVKNLLDNDYRSFGVLALNQLNAEERVEPFVTPGQPQRFQAGIRVEF